MRYTLAGCSRMRVGKGSSERKEIEKMIKIVLKTSKNRKGGVRVARFLELVYQ